MQGPAGDGSEEGGLFEALLPHGQSHHVPGILSKEGTIFLQELPEIPGVALPEAIQGGIEGGEVGAGGSVQFDFFPVQEGEYIDFGIGMEGGEGPVEGLGQGNLPVAFPLPEIERGIRILQDLLAAGDPIGQEVDDGK